MIFNYFLQGLDYIGILAKHKGSEMDLPDGVGQLTSQQQIELAQRQIEE